MSALRPQFPPNDAKLTVIINVSMHVLKIRCSSPDVDVGNIVDGLPEGYLQVPNIGHAKRDNEPSKIYENVKEESNSECIQVYYRRTDS